MNYMQPNMAYAQNNMGNMFRGYNYTQPYNNMALNGIQQPYNLLPCKSVTSIDEAKGQILDNPLVPNIFTNLPNKEIYVKFVDEMGNAKLLKYTEYTEEKPKEEKKDERLSSIEEELKSLRQEIIGMKGVEENEFDKSCVKVKGNK